MIRTCTLQTWNPRPACGTAAFSSVRISISVCVCVCACVRYTLRFQEFVPYSVCGGARPPAMETSIRAPAAGTFDHAVTPLSLFCFHGGSHGTSHQTQFPSALQLLIAAFIERCCNIFKHSADRGLCHHSVPSFLSHGTELMDNPVTKCVSLRRPTRVQSVIPRKGALKPPWVTFGLNFFHSWIRLLN